MASTERTRNYSVCLVEFYGINHARPLITHDLQWHWRYLEFIKMEALDATSAWVLLFAASLCHLGWCIIKPCNFWIYSLMDSSTWRSVLAINMYLKYQFSCYTEDCIVLPYELLWEVTSIYEIYMTLKQNMIRYCIHTHQCFCKRHKSNDDDRRWVATGFYKTRSVMKSEVAVDAFGK